jgi:probable 2-oxoglutarate dehydrogenase E1 component DHKTD1
MTLYSPVGALDAGRYGLSSSTPYPLQGILHVPPTRPRPTAPSETAAPPRTETGEGTEVNKSLEQITEHLMGVYVDKIGYEYMHCPDKDERLYVPP